MDDLTHQIFLLGTTGTVKQTIFREPIKLKFFLQPIVIFFAAYLGKTLAYAVPLIQKLQSMTPALTRHDGIHTLVIVPTREVSLLFNINKFNEISLFCAVLLLTYCKFLLTFFF